MKKILSFALCLLLALSFSAGYAEISVGVSHTVGGSGETALFTGFGPDGAEKWELSFSEPAGPDVDLISWYVSRGASPVLYVNCSSSALYAVDAETGAAIWQIPVTQKVFGASNSMVCGPDGSLYIGGWYGPDPICVSPEGSVVWTSDSSQAGEDVYMLFCLLPLSGGIGAFYDGWNESGHRTGILYGYGDGAAVSSLPDGLCACVQALAFAESADRAVMASPDANAPLVEQMLCCLAGAALPDEAVLLETVGAYLKYVSGMSFESFLALWEAVDSSARSLLSEDASSGSDGAYGPELYGMLDSAVRRAADG